MSEPLQWAFLVDENLSRKLTIALRDVGHRAVHVYDVGLISEPDATVWAYAQQYGLTIITQDEGFGDPRQYAPPHAGIILTPNPARLSADHHIAHIIRMLSPLREPSLANLFMRIEMGSVRLRAWTSPPPSNPEITEP